MSKETPLEVDVTTAAKMLAAGAALIDVREPAEIAICSIAGSINIPMHQVPAAVASLPADRPLLVLCHVGVRSRHITQFLRARGRNDVSNIAGGIAAWSEVLDPSLARY